MTLSPAYALAVDNTETAANAINGTAIRVTTVNRRSGKLEKPILPLQFSW
jgi:hypothetical protein